MLIYIFLIILIFINFKFIKNKKAALIISFGLITLLACLRNYTVGADTEQFYRMYAKIGENASWDYKNFRYEPGFFYLCKLLYNVWSNPQFLIIVSSLFINYSVFRFIKNNSKNYFISTILYITMNIFFSYMNVMRQALAIAIVLFGVNYLYEKKNIRFIITVLLATLFHDVAWAIMLLAIFNILPRKKYVFICSILLALFLFFEYDKLFAFLSSIFGHANYANNAFRS